MTEPQSPVRYCHGCENYDRAPRFVDIGDAANPADDKLYHYDCIPANVRAQYGIEDDHPAIKATSEGVKNDDLRALMTDYAQNLEEAPADNPSEA